MRPLVTVLRDGLEGEFWEVRPLFAWVVSHSTKEVMPRDWSAEWCAVYKIDEILHGPP